MKKSFMILVIFLSFTAFAFAGGDKVRSDKGQGSTGDSGGGTVTQQQGE